MRAKTESSVLFINNMSAEEEYEVIHRRASRRRREPPRRLSGERILVSGSKLFGRIDMPCVDLVYDECDEKIFNMFMCLTRLPPLYNFILNLGEKCQEMEEFGIMSRFSRFLGLLTEGREGGVSDILVEPESIEYSGIYSELTKAVHDELCARYTFEEDVWSTASKEQSVEIRTLYSEYSPVVEMFQGKALVNHPQPYTVMFEKIRLPSDGTVGDALKSFLNTEKYEVIKVPPVLTLVADGKSNIDVTNDVCLTVSGVQLSLHGLISAGNSSNYCYVRDGDRWYEYGRDEVRRVSGMEFVRGNPVILFYVKQE